MVGATGNLEEGVVHERFEAIAVSALVENDSGLVASLPLDEGMTGQTGKSKKRRTGGLLTRRKR